MSTYDALVARHGLSEAHRLVLDAVPDGARVLDVGCAGGHLAAALTARGCTVLGVELHAAAARARGIEVVEGSIDDASVREQLGDGFDAVLCADVLEHLPRPEATLAFLAGRLRPGGRAVVSLPNAGHWTMRRALLRGRFPQEDFGLFDRTHLRWFTRAAARALVQGAGLTIAGERFTSAPLPLEAHVALPARLRAAAVRRRPELFALQTVLEGVKP
ncbi:MAG: class SAM-dependent methyltransferase [Solirubrobacteraceae bacterium]|nr:class SAM-dependent methyltransferase [Solirubrobacteraceae bacterium]